MMNPETPLRRRLSRRFFRRHPSVVGAALIGHGFARRIGDEWMGGRIVETEAYLAAGDPASHSHAGIRPKCKSMFEDAGTLYVYSIHAKQCANIVTQRQASGSAVLIRAIEPLWGLDRMRLHRGQDDSLKLTRGPGMLCQALQIRMEHDGLDLIEATEFAVFRLPRRVIDIAAGPRIGISRAVDLPLRFYLRHSRYVSGSLKHRS
jgi:DNA-3-methyladenine glycosylase